MIREAIQKELSRRKMTATALAASAGWHVNDLTRYLRGERDITAARAATLLAALHLRIARASTKK